MIDTTYIEQSLIKSLKNDAQNWKFSITPDKDGVMVLNGYLRSGVSGIGVHGIHERGVIPLFGGHYRAWSDKLNFSTRFSREWYLLAKKIHDARVFAENEVCAAAHKDRMEKYFRQ